MRGSLIFQMTHLWLIAELDQNLLKNDDAKKACIDLLKNMGRNVVEKTSLGLIKASDLDKLTKNRLSAFIDAKNEIDSFKDTLRVYGQQLRKKDKENRPVIIFIDELDRCRPNYAIEILEIIKHLFDIENYVFCLAIDKKQLISSIGTVYGTTLDGEAYLRKFIEWNYKLPDPEPENFIEYLIEKFNLDEVYHTTFDKDDHTYFPKILAFYSRIFQLRLRDIERHFTSYNIIARSIPANQPHFPRILSLLIILRDKKPDLYKEYCLNSGSEEKLHSYMESLLAPNNRIDKDFYKEKIYSHIIAGVNNSDAIYLKQKEIADKNDCTQIMRKYIDTLEKARRICGNFEEWPSPGDTIANYLYKYIETVKN